MSPFPLLHFHTYASVSTSLCDDTPSLPSNLSCPTKSSSPPSSHLSQVVRADLKELWDLDLQGAPYAYTPFCSSREETLGYQFWRGGFWQSHLGGKPYHISALYVVDLKTFRRMAVGDVVSFCVPLRVSSPSCKKARAAIG